MEIKRKKYQGVLNILSFNRHFYVFGLLALFALVASYFLFHWSFLLFSLVIVLFLFGLIMPLLVSAYVYDFSGFYDFAWLKEMNLDDSADQFNLNSDTLYGYGNKNFSLKLKHIYSNKLTGIYTVGYDKYSYNITSDKVPVNAFKLNFGIQQLFAKAMYNYTLNVKHSFDFGVNTLLYNLSPGTFAPLNQNSLVAFNKINTERALETALFFTDHYTISSKLKLDLGCWSIK